MTALTRKVLTAESRREIGTAVLPKSQSLSLESGPDPYPTEAAAPSTSEAESHSAEQSDGTTGTFPIGICIPHIQMFHIHGEILVLGFIEPSNLITRYFSDQRHPRAWRKGRRIHHPVV